jgi:hypothetical protein
VVIESRINALRAEGHLGAYSRSSASRSCPRWNSGQTCNDMFLAVQWWSCPLFYRLPCFWK